MFISLLRITTLTLSIVCSTINYTEAREFYSAVKLHSWFCKILNHSTNLKQNHTIMYQQFCPYKYTPTQSPVHGLPGFTTLSPPCPSRERAHPHRQLSLRPFHKWGFMASPLENFCYLFLVQQSQPLFLLSEPSGGFSPLCQGQFCVQGEEECGTMQGFWVRLGMWP